MSAVDVPRDLDIVCPHCGPRAVIEALPYVGPSGRQMHLEPVCVDCGQRCRRADGGTWWVPRWLELAAGE